MCHSTTHRSIYRLPLAIGAGVTLLVVSCIAPAYSQSVGGSGNLGSLGQLLGQLENLQDVPGVNERLRGFAPPSKPLEGARRRGEEKAQSLEERGFERLDPERRTTELTDLGRQLIEKYCRGELPPALKDQVGRLNSFSRLEKDYCLRTSEVLFQYGYDLFANRVAAVPSGTEKIVGAVPLSVGAVPPTYVLGIDDEIVVTFSGQESRTETVVVDREGRVLLIGWQPIPAAGRTFGEFKRELEARTATTRLGTEVFVSLGAVRAVTVTVFGEVEKPGRHQLTALSSIVDAISFAGGVKKTGSVRRIYLRRGDAIYWFDAYDLLFSNMAAHDITLFDGDRIVVPPIGDTIAVFGSVKRPAIYELPEGDRISTISDILALAGGTLRPTGYAFVQISFDEFGKEVVSEHTNVSKSIRSGDLILVRATANVQIGSVSLTGHVRTAGRRSLTIASTLSELVGDASNFKRDPYLPFAALETTDPQTRAIRLFPVNLNKILAGEQDYTLRDSDRLIVLSSEDIRFLSTKRVQRVLQLSGRRDIPDDKAPSESRNPAAPVDGDGQNALTIGGLGIVRSGLTGPDKSGQEESAAKRDQSVSQFTDADCRGLQRLAMIADTTPIDRFAAAIRTFGAAESDFDEGAETCPAIFERFPNLLPLALEHVVAVNGEVRRPGAYPVVGESYIDVVVAVAGGLSRGVDLTRVEVSRFTPDRLQGIANVERGMVNLAAQGTETVSVGPGDVIRFNAVFTDREAGPVHLLGEVIRPGIYEIRRGEQLSELIARAGGLTAQAYPYGAIFTRERVKEEQSRGFRRAARELNASLAVAAVQRGSGVSAGTLAAIQQITQQLQSVEALGRVVIEADPSVLRARPEFDIVLEPGDRLLIPKRPNFVTVIGDVLNPGAMQFISGSRADIYIRQAGSYQQSADEDRVFVVFPNGSAEPLALSPWNFNPVQIPPGSTIVVPKDPTPLDLLTVVREGADLISKIAVTAASLAVISRN